MQPRKIRASSMGRLTTGVSLDPPVLTKADHAALNKLTECAEKGRNPTPKQIEDHDNAFKKLHSKPALPTELTAGQKTHVQDIWYGEKFDFFKTFHNKFVDKGDFVEDKSIRDVLGMLGSAYKFTRKNEKTFENEFCTGTPDLLINSAVIDMKNVYYPNGLKFFRSGSASEAETIHLYKWQVKSYCWLTRKTTGFIINYLCNPPEHILEKEIWNYFKQSKEETLTDEFRDYVRDLFDFEGKKTIEERTMMFRFDLTENDVKIMENQVKLMNEYWNILDEEFATKNKHFHFFRETNH